MKEEKNINLEKTLQEKDKDAYYFGLDIGTNSVGWAATNTKYELLHLRHKSAWGVRLFEEAQTAQARRMYRSNRRRIQRSHKRIEFLQDLFRNEMEKVDPTFFVRLNNSFFHVEDKDPLLNNSKYAIADDEYLNDKIIYEKYKTIYHLQKQLISDPETKYDLRLIYLALHHLIKYRGHFVQEDRDFNIDSFGKEQLNEGFSEINSYLNDKEVNFSFDLTKLVTLQKDLRKVKGIKRTTELLTDLFFGETKLTTQITNIIKLIAGASVSLNALFDDYGGEKTDKLQLSSLDYETLYDQYEQIVGEDVALIDSAKKLFDYIEVARVMKGQTLFCDAMIDKYETHKEDLKQYKAFIKNNFVELYNQIFRGEGEHKASYSRYIGFYKTKNKKQYLKKVSLEDLHKEIRKLIESVKKNKETLTINEKYIVNRLEEGDFLEKLNSTKNGSIPYQFNLYQVKKILANASKHYDFFNNITDNLTVSEKIVSIIKFRIPYYVGPLTNNKESKFAWSVKNKGQELTKVTPWNFETVINEKESALRFIERMTNDCSELSGEKVLPKSSLLYEEYEMLNKLNGLKINDERIKPDIKKLIIEQLVNRKTRVKMSDIEKYLVGRFNHPVKVEGLEENAFIDTPVIKRFRSIFNGEIDNNREMIEKIIFYRTIFSDKKMFEQKINEFTSLDDYQRKEILRLNYSGWGKFSTAFLTGYSPYAKKALLVRKDSGEVISIIDLLRNNEKVFNELLYDTSVSDPTIREIIDDYNIATKNIQEEESYVELVEESYLSPSVKRSVIQALKIVNEIIKINKNKVPAKIFVEVTRSDEVDKKGKTTTSRKDNITKLYSAIKDTAVDLKDLKNELSLKDDQALRSKKLFLYFMQQGKCMYTGQHIELGQLENYDIDHIYPQSVIKDDSFDNTVLVVAEANRTKGDNYPISSEIRSKQRQFWDNLLKNQFISDKKHARLIRNTELTEDEISTFINRQLVVTSQATTGVARILKQLFKNQSEIVFVKSRLVSDFRNDILDYPKLRELNKAHHAHDAYFNIIVGNFFNGIYTRRFYLKEKFKYNPSKAFKRDEIGLWSLVQDKKTVFRMLKRKDILFTTKTGGSEEAFYNETKMSPANKLIPLKGKGVYVQTNKYGGYTGLKTSHFILIKNNGKNKTENRLFAIDNYSLIDRNRYDLDKKRILTLEEHVGKQFEGFNIEILKNYIPSKSIIELKGVRYCITGKDKVDRFYFTKSYEPFFDNSFNNTFSILIKINNLIKDKKINPDLDEFKYRPTSIDKSRVITNETLVLEFTTLMDYTSGKPYNVYYPDISTILSANLQKFKESSFATKVQVLIDIISLLQTGSIPSLKSLNDLIGKPSINVISISSKTDASSYLILQSITGMFEKKVPLG